MMKSCNMEQNLFVLRQSLLMYTLFILELCLKYFLLHPWKKIVQSTLRMMSDYLNFWNPPSTLIIFFPKTLYNTTHLVSSVSHRLEFHNLVTIVLSFLRILFICGSWMFSCSGNGTHFWWGSWWALCAVSRAPFSKQSFSVKSWVWTM